MPFQREWHMPSGYRRRYGITFGYLSFDKSLWTPFARVKNKDLPIPHRTYSTDFIPFIEYISATVVTSYFPILRSRALFYIRSKSGDVTNLCGYMNYPSGEKFNLAMRNPLLS